MTTTPRPDLGPDAATFNSCPTGRLEPFDQNGRNVN